jgi:hypothetical protein
LREAVASNTLAAGCESLFARRDEGFSMVRSCTIFAGLALAAGAAGHFYFGLSRDDAGLLTLCGLCLALLYAVTLPWRKRRADPQRLAEPQNPTAAVLAYRVADLERRLAALEVQVAATNLDMASSAPMQQDPALRARARAELALAAAAIDK